jgi:very-short-patch-repair endonuclease
LRKRWNLKINPYKRDGLYIKGWIEEMINKIKNNCYYCYKEFYLSKKLMEKKKKEGSKHFFCNRICYRRYAKIPKNNPQYGKQPTKGKHWKKSKEDILKTVNKRKINGTYKNKNQIGKTYEEMYGLEKAIELRKKISEKQKIAWKNPILIKYFSEKRKMLIKEGKVKSFKSDNNPSKTEEFKKMIKELRKNFIFPKKDTGIEVKIQNFLKELGITFFTHQYMHIEHGYQCDILIPSINMVIECDGDYWHKYPTGNDVDHIRTKELIEKGFKVLRLWEHEINAMDLNKFKEELPDEVKFLMKSNIKK